MRTLRSDAGEGKLSTIVFLLILVVAVYFAVKFVPVRIDAYSFKDTMAEQASFASSRSDESIRKALIIKARELELPIDEERIKVSREGSRIKVTADYTAPVETIFFTYQWRFSPKVAREIF